jgi:hypothetical protein
MMGRSLADIQTRYPHLPYQLQASENGLPMIDRRRSAEPDSRLRRHPESAGRARHGTLAANSTAW